MQPRTVVWTVILSLAACAPAAAQTISSSIFGTVVDAQGSGVPQATVTARNLDENTSTPTKTSDDGSFVFPRLLAGRYTLTVEKAGFKELAKTDVVLDVFTNFDVGKLALQVGAVTEVVSVTAERLPLQTESGERSTTIVGEQLENIEVAGRSPLALLNTIPGVRTDLDPTIAGINVGNVWANGSRGLSYNITFNGAANQDMGGNSRMLATLSMEAVSEFKVLTNSYDALFGRSSGAQIVVQTKSGSSTFHGQGYWYYRDKGMNANTWDNNRQPIPAPKPSYHFNYLGYTLGGPIYIPGKFNTNKDKLFFFWNDEYQPQTLPSGRHLLTVPTANERLGNFANPYGVSGGGCLPGQYLNITGGAPQCKTLSVPSSATLYQPGLAALSIFPLPNVDSTVSCPQDTNYNSPTALGLTGGHACSGYNFISQLPDVDKRHEQLLRIDNNLTDKWRLFGSYTHLVSDPDTSPFCPRGSGYSLCGNVPLVPGGYVYNHPGHIVTGNLTRTFSPNTINEAQFNYAHRRSTILPAGGINDLSYAAFGITDSSKMLPTLFPPFPNWIPNLLLGQNISNAPNLRTNGEWAPFYTYASSLEWIDNFSKVWRKHLIRTGVYIQRYHKDQTAFASTPGTYDFRSPDPASPGDTSYGYGNAAYGLVNSFYQANNFLNGQYRWTNFEPYIQDTWKVTRRFTLIYALRLYWVQPQYDQALQTSNFFPNLWNPAQAPRLYYPCPPTVSCPAGQTAYDSPLDGGTGATARTDYIGRIVPGSGNLLNGIAQGNGSVGKYLYKGTGLLPGPRLGLALDLTGHSNLIFRAGGGIYYDRFQGNEVFNLITNPPAIQQPTLRNLLASNMSPGAGAGVPPGVPSITGISYDARVPTTYNLNTGIQAKLPKTITLDISYVGAMGRKLLYNYNINAVPYGADFLPANQDPTKQASSTSNHIVGSDAYAADYLRPYRGYGDITMESFGATSSFNSLQVTVDKRTRNGLFVSGSFTFGKCLTWASGDGDPTRIDSLSPRVTNWGRCSYDLTKDAKFTYIYPIPSLAAHVSLFNNGFGRAVFAGWQVSGFTQFRNGAVISPSVSVSFSGFSCVPGPCPNGVSPTPSLNSNITGTPSAGPRIRLVGDPFAGTTNSGTYNRLNHLAFAAPLVGDIGLGAPVNYLNTPGVNNWDMSVQRTFALGERMRLNFRLDAFNAFNHTQFNGLNTSLTYTGTYNPITHTFTVNPCPTNTAVKIDAVTCAPILDSNGNQILNNTGGFGATFNHVRDPRRLQILLKLQF